MAMDKKHFEKRMIRESELVCRLGDHLRLIADVRTYDNITDEPTDMVADGQIYLVDGRKGAGWDLVKISGTGPNELRVLNWDILTNFEIVTKFADEPDGIRPE